MKCSSTRDSSASSRSSAISAMTPAMMALVIRNHSSLLQKATTEGSAESELSG